MSKSEEVVQDSLEAKLRQRMAQMQPEDTFTMKADERGSRIPNTLLSVAVISFCLGSVFLWGLRLAIFGPGVGSWWWTTPQLGFFIAALTAFHFGEFATTAGWNRKVCSVDSFLLEHGWTYHSANATALVEYLIFLYLKPSWKTWPYASAVGAIMVICGQVLRSAAMITAANNFNHLVQYKKADSHKLVTVGVYSWFRHPSYAGFYYWALGTQIVLQNPITFVVFAILLWRFFYQRTRAEEYHLVRFFGDEYKEYRRRVGTKIPFVA